MNTRTMYGIMRVVALMATCLGLACGSQTWINKSRDPKAPSVEVTRTWTPVRTDETIVMDSYAGYDLCVKDMTQEFKENGCKNIARSWCNANGHQDANTFGTGYNMLYAVGYGFYTCIPLENSSSTYAGAGSSWFSTPAPPAHGGVPLPDPTIDSDADDAPSMPDDDETPTDDAASNPDGGI